MRKFLIFMLACFPAVAVGDPTVRDIEVGFTRLATVDEGQGVPIVFVHGAMYDWRAYEPMRPTIAREFRTVVYSRRYHYPNQWDDDGENYTISQHVEDLAELIRTLKLGRVHLFGGSYGGRIAGHFALTHPDMLRSVMLSDPFLIEPDTREGQAAREAYNRDMEAVNKLIQEKKLDEAAAALYDAVDAPDWTYARESTEFKKRWMDNIRTLAPMFAASFPPAPSCEELSALKVPVLLLTGSKTRDFFALGTARLKTCLPASTEVAAIPNAPHMWYPVNPAAGTEAILKFARSH